MSVQGVAFRPPDPYPLPADFAGHLRSQPEADALRMIAQLLVDNHCADLAFIERLDRDGHLRLVAAAGVGPGAVQVAQDLMVDSAQTSYALESEAGAASTSGQAIKAGSGMLFMGEITADEAALPQPRLRSYLLGGADKANLGFYYVNPIVDATGKAHGTVTLSRSLASGALNHDQPALVRALVLLLADNLASAPII